ncbi:NADPH2:quinone reductase [Paraburkholderia youngii]
MSVGRDVTRFAVGDMVCALVPGGGYAEYTVAHERSTLAVPDGLSMIEAAAMPETFLTVWLNLFQRGRFAAGESVLIHGGASGIGTAATMLAKAFGASKIITTVSSDVQRTASIALGADVAIDYRKEDFVKAVMEATDGRGVDVVVDIVAGDYVARNYAAAAMDGRIVQIGVIKGPAQALDLFPMLAKRLMHIGSTLRSRTHEEKAELIEDLKRSVWPHIRRGAVKPAIFQTFDLDDARGAHALMDSGLHIGKIVLTCR